MHSALSAFQARPDNKEMPGAARDDRVGALEPTLGGFIQAGPYECEADLASVRRLVRELRPSSRTEMHRTLAQIAAVALLSGLAILGWVV